MTDINTQLIKEFNLKPFQVINTVNLIDQGNTIPFIARYRKEAVGELNDQVLRELHDRLLSLRNLEERRTVVERLIDEQGKLTVELGAQLQKAVTLQEIEDIYRPFKQKRRTRASIAREKGLEPLAQIIYEQTCGDRDILKAAKDCINEEKGVNSEEDALNGAMDIIAEDISDNAFLRKQAREFFFRYGTVISKAKKQEDSVYRMYYNFREAVSEIAGYRVLALNRGEKEDYLQVEVEVPHETVLNFLNGVLIKKTASEASRYVLKAVRDSYERLLFPSIERVIRNELTIKAENQAMKVFSENLRNLLMQPPVKGRIVIGLDPAYRTGCKTAVVDETGKVLATTVIYPAPPQSRITEATKILLGLIEKYMVDIISIGNGTASRETEIFVAETLKLTDRRICYMVVSEAGASVYSASKLGAEEFPRFDVALRSAVSIARRLQDPLAELVKIDPGAIGVGQYQHDLNQKHLSECLRGVVEDCVNSVGVDLNTASPSLLSYISGINSSVAKNIADYREANGKFIDRAQLKKVKKLGDKAFEQCAGFLRIPEGRNILDNTSVHPESYEAALQLLELTGFTPEDVKNGRLTHLKGRIDAIGLTEICRLLDIGMPTLNDIIHELAKPGRDPRDELPQPILYTEVLDMSDLKPGMLLTGTVRNVADFGAFVDIGVHQDGLVHISQLSDRFVHNPMEVVSAGDIVKVRVIDVDVQRKRISLSMKSVE